MFTSKLLGIYDFSNIDSIPAKLKLKEVENYLNLTKPKINEKNVGTIEQYFIINQRIKNIKKNLIELKNNEMKRIFEEYLKKGYNRKYMVEKETVLSALIGQDNVLPELTKQMKETKVYFESIKKCGLMNQSFNKNQKINEIDSLLIEKN